ncbi:MAG: TlpA disulfide reductase family protein [Chloroflexota bacterium]
MSPLTTREFVQPKSPRSRIWLPLAVFAIMLLFVAACVSQPNGATTGESQSAANVESEPGLPPAPKAGHPAPNFTLVTLDGESLSLAELQGKPVILNFWATWCGPCRLEMPHLEQAYQENLDDNVVILGVNLTQRENNSEDIPIFVDEFALTFPIVLDEEGDVAKLYEIRGQPASVFINRDGVVNSVFNGPVTKTFIEERIAELLSS